MTSGILLTTFDPRATPDAIKAAITAFYKSNSIIIAGMEYKEFEDNSVLGEVSNYIERNAEAKLEEK